MKCIENRQQLVAALDEIIRDLANVYGKTTVKERIDILQQSVQAYTGALSQFGDKAKWALAGLAASLAIPATIAWKAYEETVKGTHPSGLLILQTSAIAALLLIITGCQASIRMLQNYYDIYATSVIDSWIHHMAAGIPSASWSLHADVALRTIHGTTCNKECIKLNPENEAEPASLSLAAFLDNSPDRTIYCRDECGIAKGAVRILVDAWRLRETNTFQQYRLALYRIAYLAKVFMVAMIVWCATCLGALLTN